MKNNVYNLLGGGGRMLLFLITIPLLINYMGLERYGLWVLLTSVGNMALLLDSGLIGTSMFFVSKELNRPKELKTTVTSLIVINLIIVLIIIIIYLLFFEVLLDVFFTNNGFDEQNLRYAIIVVGVYTSILISHNIFIGIIQSHENFKDVNIIKFLFLAFQNFGLIALSYLNSTFFMMALWMVLCCFVGLIIYIKLSRKYVKLMRSEWCLDKLNFIDVATYSLNTWVGYSGNVLFGQVDKIVLGLISTPYIVGAYSAIISITTYINSLATVGLQPVIPTIAKLFPDLKSKKKEILTYFVFTVQFNTMLVFTLGLFMIPFLDIIIYDIMDIERNSLNMSFYFFIAIVIYSLNSLYVPGFYSLMAIKESKIVGRVQLMSAIISLIMIYVLGKEFGLLGAIVGNIGFAVSHYFNYRISHFLSENKFLWLRSILSLLFVYLVSIFLIYISFNNFYGRLLFSLTAIILLAYLFFSKNKEIIINTFLKRK